MNQSVTNSLKIAVMWIALLLAVPFFVAPAHAWEGDLGGNQYNAPEARRYQRVQLGVVEDIRMVVVTRESRSAGYVGGGVGAIVGGIIGNTAGNGKGRMVAAAVGGTIGGIAGKMAGDYVGREEKRSAEIIVSMSNGNAVSVVQELDPDTMNLRPGDRVRLIEGQAVRVVKIRSSVM